MHLLSNSVNEIPSYLYKFDYSTALALIFAIKQIQPEIKSKELFAKCVHRLRNKQTPELLHKLHQTLRPCIHQEWLAKRGVTDTSEIYSIGHGLTHQDMLDLFIYPNDFILDYYQNEPITGPVFPDFRNGVLVGVCIRNISEDLGYAAAEKFTTSNFGWFLDGYDLYNSFDEIFIVEGVFDALAMRKHGYKTISVASSCPTALQLACLLYKFKKFNICFDNDFWGHVGAYTIGKMTGMPIFIPESKDPGICINSQMVLNRIGIVALKRMMEKEMIKYQHDFDDGKILERPLPYNL